ncbi:MAG: ABC transporter ATP-binding protein [Promethearchaeota archaeon]
MSFFEVKNLYFRFNDQWILKDISFQGKKGELIAIVGPSGCGKTTLLRTIVGILIPQRGQILIDQEEITHKAIEKRKVGYVPQNQGLFPHLTVYDNVAFGLVAQKWEKKEVQSRVDDLIKMGELENLLKRRPHELSGGQQQRVALLRALAPSPNLLLLDEPLSNVDTHLREQLAIYIRNIQKLSSITTLFVTHDLNEAKMLADKIVIIDEGQVLQKGSPMEISLNPQTVEAAMALGLKNLFKVHAITREETNDNAILVTEIGDIDIPTKLVINKDNKPKAVYIDPTQVQILKEEIFEGNNFVGEIVAIIPDPMVHQSTLLIKVNQEEFALGSQISYQNKILHVQIPVTDKNYQISEKIYIKFSSEALKLYN